MRIVRSQTRPVGSVQPSTGIARWISSMIKFVALHAEYLLRIVYDIGREADSDAWQLTADGNWT